MKEYFLRVTTCCHGSRNSMKVAMVVASVVADEKFSINYPKLPTLQGLKVHISEKLKYFRLYNYADISASTQQVFFFFNKTLIIVSLAFVHFNLGQISSQWSTCIFCCKQAQYLKNFNTKIAKRYLICIRWQIKLAVTIFFASEKFSN